MQIPMMMSRRAPDLKTIHVHLTHACPILRAGLATILSMQEDFEVTSGEQLPRQFSQQSILVTDYTAGMAAAAQTWPRPGYAPRVLVLTTRDKEWEVRMAIDGGVQGYILQGCAAEELVQGVRTLSRGVSYLSAPATRSVVDSLSRAALTPRETDVLQVMAKGGSDKLIARELGIGTGTVKSHVKHLLEKLEATARTHAVVVAMERGLLSERQRPPVARAAVRQAAY